MEDMLFSKSCIYGLQSSLYLALKKTDEFTPIRLMSEDLGISFHFLTKILQQLTANNLLESFKGPNGGVRLKRSGDEITFMDIVMAIDGPELFSECALGLPGCGVEKPCPFHEQWSKTRENIEGILAHTTINQLATKVMQENLRLTDKDKLEKIFQLK